jgi:Terpene cyclase DEP1
MRRILNHKHYFYLLLAIAGGGWTFFCALKGVQQHNNNFDIGEFIASTWTNDFYARSITLDFWTGAIAGTFFILVEGIRLKMKRIWLYLLLTVLVAFAFSLPLFLFMRERQLKHT